MNRFSNRIGVTKVPTELQIGKINDALRNSLWNLIVSTFEGRWKENLKILFVNFFKESLERIPYDAYDCRKWLSNSFSELQWYEVYNLIEDICQHIKAYNTDGKRQQQFEEHLNYILERELSGYRSIRKELVPVTDPNEISSILEAINSSESNKFAGIKRHFINSLDLLGKKPDPDYANSIKESISAVEALCKLLTNEKSGGIDKALEKLNSKIGLHPALKNGIKNFYGYTCDEAGIRHPLMTDSTLGFAEAKFMLVSCSALVNFIIDKARISKFL